jgi:hypothetical protein
VLCVPCLVYGVSSFQILATEFGSAPVRSSDSHANNLAVYWDLELKLHLP